MHRKKCRCVGHRSRRNQDTKRNAELGRSTTATSDRGDLPEARPLEAGDWMLRDADADAH
jgi:hypothetical protein